MKVELEKPVEFRWHKVSGIACRVVHATQIVTEDSRPLVVPELAAVGFVTRTSSRIRIERASLKPAQKHFGTTWQAVLRVFDLASDGSESLWLVLFLSTPLTSEKEADAVFNSAMVEMQKTSSKDASTPDAVKQQRNAGEELLKKDFPDASLAAKGASLAQFAACVPELLGGSPLAAQIIQSPALAHKASATHKARAKSKTPSQERTIQRIVQPSWARLGMQDWSYAEIATWFSEQTGKQIKPDSVKKALNRLGLFVSKPQGPRSKV